MTLFVQLWGGIDEAVLGDIALKYNLSDDAKQRLKSGLVLLKGMHRGNKSNQPKDAASSTVKHMQQLGVALGKVDALLKDKKHPSSIYAASRAVFANRDAADAVDEVTAMFTKLQSDVAEMRARGYFNLRATELPQDQLTPLTTYRTEMIGSRLPALYAEATGKKFGGSKVADQAQNVAGFAFVNLCLRAMGLVTVSPETIASHKNPKKRRSQN